MTAPVRPQAKSVTHDVSEYLFFSPSTTGLSGSPVKIRADLFMDFFCNVDPQTHDGQRVIRDIESLKIFGKTASHNAHVSVPARNDSAAHKNRLNRINQTLSVLSFNQSTSPEKTFATKNVRVFYRVLQQEGDAFPTVYISDIRVVQRGSGDIGGLYEYVTTKHSEELTKTQNTNLDGKKVFISGASETAEGAFYAARIATKSETPTLFFCPQIAAQDLSIWSKPRLSGPTKELIKELTELLQQNQKRSVHWLVEGVGAAVLSCALEKVPGTLEKHSFKFVNARTNVAKLLQDLGRRKAQLQGEFLDYSRDHTALLSIAQNSSEIAAQLKHQLPNKTGYDRVSHRYLMDYFHALGENGNAKAILTKALSIKGKGATFIEAITSSHKVLR
jgi:hypothetical protein